VFTQNCTDIFVDANIKGIDYLLIMFNNDSLSLYKRERMMEKREEKGACIYINGVMVRAHV
jgi:hypothetical protein